MGEEIKEGGISFKFSKFPLSQIAVLIATQHCSTEQTEPPWNANSRRKNEHGVWKQCIIQLSWENWWWTTYLSHLWHEKKVSISLNNTFFLCVNTLMVFVFMLSRAARTNTRPRILKYFTNMKTSQQPWKDYIHIACWYVGKSRSLPWVIK